MPVIKRILAEIGRDTADGRPLYAVPLTEERHAELGQMLHVRLATGEILDSTAARFVLWAAEHIRARFKGGPLTWEFVFRGLGRPGDHSLGKELVERGLRWWKRPVRISEAGIHLYLHTLMAEGGLPQALLVQQGLYGRLIKGLLADFEAEGADIPDDLACRIAAQRVAGMPQTFQSQDIVRLLADLGLALVRLRAEPPKDIPTEIIDRWLDRNRPDWVRSLPLRLSKEVAENLIRPALRAERRAVSLSGPPAWRALVRNEGSGEWQSVVRLGADGVLSAHLLPSTAHGLWLRFLATGDVANRTSAIVYSASPIERGWELRRLGGGATALTLDLEKPLVLAGYADGRLIDEVEVVPAFPLPDETPSFWKEEGETDQDGPPSVLLPVAEGAKTRSPRIWLLTNAETRPIVGDGVTAGEPQVGPHGLLWPLQGSGNVFIGEQCWSIATGSDVECAEARMMAHGNVLASWRLASAGGHVFLGQPALFGQRDSSSFRQLSEKEIRRRPARTLMAEIAEWVEQGMASARLRYVALPARARIALREIGAGALELLADGLPEGLVLTLEAGEESQRIRLSGGQARLAVSVAGAPPGVVRLRLKSLVDRREVELIAPWPARDGMLLGPDNRRLEQDTPLSVEALRGWRAVMPKDLRGELQLRMKDQCVAIRIEGETPLAAYTPLIRSMLAHAGPDSEVRLNLVTGGKESRRLDIRRYHHQSEITSEGKLRLGLKRDGVAGEGVFRQISTQAIAALHAIDLNNPERVLQQAIEAQGEIDLRALLPDGETLWLIQPSLNGQIQRAAVWSPTPIPFSTREQRIEKYADTWRILAASRDRAEWRRQWKLIHAAIGGGDAGILDQVQALARVPQAAVRLILRVSKADLAQALALDLATPIFWPVFPISAFAEALSVEHSCLVEQYVDVLEDESEAKQEAVVALARRVEDILSLHAELAGHLGAALSQAELFPQMPVGLLQKVAVPPSKDRLVALTHEAARRHDWLPSGIKGLTPISRPSGMPSFNAHVQKLVEAPLVAAEMAAGLRGVSNDPRTMLTLINLRLVDPHYFDAALPVALALLLQKVVP
ncbi:hypothetical protein J2Z31_005223 [Sinorhizobium kostiense]|uniref:Uncharacterized protein n=1 Tax=Sinorhizobium kostiense TaxID=76747 RepID=A0ABS4RA14_9HYPH|nr:STY4851/ECs_5259 family protein [Sinorhizobium kostiense]MBP2238682.1 hypothetical protein [Sinorhizobium kostiense]